MHDLVVRLEEILTRKDPLALLIVALEDEAVGIRGLVRVLASAVRHKLGLVRKYPDTKVAFVHRVLSSDRPLLLLVRLHVANQVPLEGEALPAVVAPVQ